MTSATETTQMPERDTTDYAAKTVHVTKTYGSGESQFNALNDVSVNFKSGEFTAIMGPSGSGKSTLMHCAAGLDRINSGEVWIGDNDITRMSEKKLTLVRRKKIGFIFQSFNLLPTLNAKENIELPSSLSGKKSDEEWFTQVVDLLGISTRLTHKPSELSGGQQQRVAVARALVARPDVIFADEPTGNLDSKAGTQVLEFMRSAVDDHKQTIVMVTHDASAAAYADRIIFLSDGEIVDEMLSPTTQKVLDKLKDIG
jgi:putative ABC transport system ATP-binding protein